MCGVYRGVSSLSFIPTAAPGMLYSSDAHVPRSITLHLSEQKGLHGFSSQVVVFLQMGHLSFISFLPFSCLGLIELRLFFHLIFLKAGRRYRENGVRLDY